VGFSRLTAKTPANECARFPEGEAAQADGGAGGSAACAYRLSSATQDKVKPFQIAVI
jgi:hypothetical protein